MGGAGVVVPSDSRQLQHLPIKFKMALERAAKHTTAHAALGSVARLSQPAQATPDKLSDPRRVPINIKRSRGLGETGNIVMA